jgi:hypothetical protein
MSETCIIRPELIEFDKTGSNYLSIVAYPSQGFVFTQTSVATNNKSDINNIPTDTSNLADITLNQINAQIIDVPNLANLDSISLAPDGGTIDMTGGVINNLGSLNTTDGLVISSNNIDLNLGNIDNVNEIVFDDGAGNGMTLGNESVTFQAGEAGAITNVETITFDSTNPTINAIDMAGGVINNLSSLIFSGAAQLNIDLGDGTLSNVDTLEIGDMRFNDLEQIYNATSGSIHFQNITVDNNALSNLDSVTTNSNSQVLLGDSSTLDMGDNSSLLFGASGTLDLGDGVVGNVNQFDMVSLGTVNMNDSIMTAVGDVTFSANKTLDLTSGTANIGGMTLMNNDITNNTVGGAGWINVEDARFTGAAIDNKNGQATPLVVQGNSSFTNTGIVVDGSSGVDVHAEVYNTTGDLSLQATGADHITVNTKRIRNLGSPQDGTDAATKDYVLQQVDQGIQGLKPKRAVDFVTDVKDFFVNDNFNTGRNVTVDGTVDNFVMTYTNATGNLEMYWYNGTAGWSLTSEPNVEFDGKVMAWSDVIDAETQFEVNNVPYQRVLIKDLNTTHYNASVIDTTIADAIFDTDATTDGVITDVAGLNGIWEARQIKMVSADSKQWVNVTLRRANDMDQSSEVMNGAYVYSKDGGLLHSNKGWVVNNADPINLDTNGRTWDTATLQELNWVLFNEVNMELSFVDPAGDPEASGIAGAFAKGGLLARFDQADEKSVMADANMLNVDFNGTTDVTLNVQGHMYFDNVTQSNIEFNQNAVINNIDPNNESITINGSKFYGDGNIDCTELTANTVSVESDRRLKKNIKPINNGLDLVGQLTGVTFNWNYDSECRLPQYGFIAQDLEAVMPTLVHTNSATDIKTVEYHKVVSVLVSAVQELSSELSELKKKLA